MRTAVVVLATGEYWRGAKVLFHTLRTVGRLPDSIDCIAMGTIECDWASTVSISQDYSWVPVSSQNFPRVADKFFALTLPYDRIVLLDADMLCVGDCSYLWSERTQEQKIHACRDTASVVYYGEKIKSLGLNPDCLFNAGAMVLHPDSLQHTLRLIMEGKLQSYDGGDQGYLNALVESGWAGLSFLPPEYNCCLDVNMPQIPSHAQRLVHFTGANANPWNPIGISPDDWRVPMFQRWRQVWEECNR
jgi:lipopolysaccharide biosynthesis glycosyltransferase